MARFFIDRPVFAWVIAIFITLAGIISITQLPGVAIPEYCATSGHCVGDLSGRNGKNG